MHSVLQKVKEAKKVLLMLTNMLIMYFNKHSLCLQFFKATRGRRVQVLLMQNITFCHKANYSNPYQVENDTESLKLDSFHGGLWPSDLMWFFQ